MHSPVTPAPPRFGAWWRLGALAAVAVLVTVAVGEARRPPGPVAAHLEHVLDETRALPGVARADLRLSRPDRDAGLAYEGDGPAAAPARDPDQWLATLTVEPRPTAVADGAEPGVRGVVAQVRAVVDQAAAQAPDGRVVWDVWLREGAEPHRAEVRLTGTDEPEAAVRGARALARGPGVRSVRVAGERAEVVVVRAAHAVGLPSVARVHGLELERLSTVDGLSAARAVQPLTGLDDPVVELLAGAELLPEVTSVHLDDRGDHLGSLLTVNVEEDGVIDLVDRWLREPGREGARGRALPYDVWSPSHMASGHVGGVEAPEPPASTEPPPAEPPPAEPTEPAADLAVPADPVPDRPAAFPEDPTAPACSTTDLTVEIAGGDAAMGTRSLLLEAFNVSGHPCAVQGRPVLAFRRLTGGLTQDVSFVPADLGPVEPPRVVVPPGRSVLSGLEWGAMSVGPRDDPAGGVVVTAAPGSETVELPVGSMRREHGYAGAMPTELDILDGAVIEVTPWLVQVEGWSVPTPP